MNNFGLIISGNLTGFTTFYETPNVNGILNGVKFNFDFRDLTTILRNEDKAYTISFAPSIIAVSLVTCLLDSFRRPGVLVVSVLLPRNKKVESAMNAHNSKALYQLLNSIHDTFREKNFVNGMLNQNKAVLMQDYYSDILSSYVLASDALQRPINTRIDVAAPNKRLGYVKSTEDNVPLYLSSLCRKSYEGYHHVFIAENAPQNIDEEPIEVVFYSVMITNNGQRFQNVKLTDKIYNLQPEEGEIDIDKNFTYQQVVNREAGRNIVASFAGDTIEITYRFGQEKRNIQFSFVDGGVVVPFASISPRVTLSNGEKFNIGSENWTFEGKEIYDRKTIESGNSNYVIKRESANLDIRRLKDGATCLIQVEQCCQIDFSFPKPYNKPKRITLKRRNGQSKSFIVEDYLNEVLPGKREEYSYIIESNFYETETGQMPPVGSSVNIVLITKKEKQGNIARTNPTGQYADAKSNKTGTMSKGVNVGGTLKLDGGEGTAQKKPAKKIKKEFFLIAVVLCGLLLGGGGYCAYTHFFNNDTTETNSDEDTVCNQQIRCDFIDETKDLFKDEPNWNFVSFDDLVSVTMNKTDGSNDGINIEDKIPSEGAWYMFNVDFDKKQETEYVAQVQLKELLDGEPIIIGEQQLNSDGFPETDTLYVVKINLYTRWSDLQEFAKIKNAMKLCEEHKIEYIEQDLYNKCNNKLAEIEKRSNDRLKGFVELFKRYLAESGPYVKKAEDTASLNDDFKPKDKINAYLDKTSVELEKIKTNVPKPNAAERVRIAAIKNAYTELRDNGTIRSYKNLSESQADVVKKLQKFYETKSSDKHAYIKSRMKKQKSFYQVQLEIQQLKDL